MNKQDNAAAANISSLHYILIAALVIILLMVIGCIGFIIYGKKTVDKLKFIEDSSFAYTNDSNSLLSNRSPGKTNRFKFSAENEQQF